jgi:ABC-2 type transport system ATP-binding protein
MPFRPAAGGALRIDTAAGTDAAQVAALAVAAGLSLLELRPADHAGLEDLFFTLTSPTAHTGAGAPTHEVTR